MGWYRSAPGESIYHYCTSAHHQPFQKSYFLKKPDFSEKQYTALLTFSGELFLEQLLFEKALPSIAVTFSEGLLFYNILFQKSYYFTVTIRFHIYTSYLFISKKVNSVPDKGSLSAGVLSCVSVIAQSRTIDG